MKGLNVNECMNDIYYINDMFISKKDAENQLRTLKEIILQEKYGGDKELMKGLANVELLYNYSAKEEFGDTYIAKIFDALEANSQISSFYNFNVWFFVGLATDSAIGKLMLKALEKPLAPIRQQMIRQIRSILPVNKKIAEIGADFLLEEALKKAAEKYFDAITQYDVSEILDKNIDEITKKIENSMLEGKSPIIVTFGQGNLFYKAIRHELSKDYNSYGVLAKFLRHVNIGQLGTNSAQPNVRIFLDNDDPAGDYTLPSSADATIANPIRYMLYQVSRELPPDYTNAEIIDLRYSTKLF
jgi:hypothetical protein